MEGAPARGVVGVVLAGGRSTRFGTEKAAALIGGSPMVQHVFGVLDRGCAHVAINAAASTQAARLAAEWGVPRLADPAGAPAGPLAGVLAGLRWAEGRGAWALATAPCDTPYLPEDLVVRLTMALDGDHGAAVARTPAGVQPLCAVWRVSAREALAEALAHRDHPPVRAVLRALGAVEIAFADERAFANLNTRDDLAALGA